MLMLHGQAISDAPRRRTAALSFVALAFLGGAAIGVLPGGAEAQPGGPAQALSPSQAVNPIKHVIMIMPRRIDRSITISEPIPARRDIRQDTATLIRSSAPASRRIIFRRSSTTAVVMVIRPSGEISTAANGRFHRRSRALSPHELRRSRVSAVQE